MSAAPHYIAFDGVRKIVSGDWDAVARAARKAGPQVLIFNDATSELVEIDLPRKSGNAETDEARKPGRPKLGVIAREVTLLPRHWEWLNVQPGGASVALRKLVDEARRVHRNTDRIRQAKEAAYKFISAMAGNEAGFEEATRGLFAGDPIRFGEYSRGWPHDVREHALRLASRAFHEDGTNE